MMIVATIIAALCGISIGLVTGLTPGVHINTVVAFLTTGLAFFSGINSFSLIIFIVSLAVSHTIFDFIPSILTGAPGEETFLTILPGHTLLKEGRGLEAIGLVLQGCLLSIPLILIIGLVYSYFLPVIFTASRSFIPFILIFVSMYVLFRETHFWTALVLWLCTGFLGFFAFNLPVKEPLLPLLSGLFGCSSLLISLFERNYIPLQRFIRPISVRLTVKEIKSVILGSLVASPLCATLPAIGSGQAAAISSEIIPQTTRGFLTLNGVINMLSMILSFVTLYTISKARTGAAAGIKKILPHMTPQEFLIVIGICLFVILICVFLCDLLAPYFVKIINHIPYTHLSLGMLLFLVIAIFFLTNVLGYLVFICSSAFGIFALRSNVKRITLMGCLIIPTILIYLSL